MPIHPPVAVERAMKIQEVILRAVSGKILWSQAAEMAEIIKVDRRLVLSQNRAVRNSLSI